MLASRADSAAATVSQQGIFALGNAGVGRANPDAAVAGRSFF